MRKTIAAVLVVLLTGAAPAPKDYGSPPAWEATTELFEIWARNGMLEPDRMRFEWPYQLVQGTLTPPLDKPIDGYYTCGRLTKDGAPAGATWFIAIARDNRVIWQNIGTGSGFDPAEDICKRLLKKGILRPLSAPAASGLIGPTQKH
jgi:hypothetical protein